MQPMPESIQTPTHRLEPSIFRLGKLPLWLLGEDGSSAVERLSSVRGMAEYLCAGDDIVGKESANLLVIKREIAAKKQARIVDSSGWSGHSVVLAAYLRTPYMLSFLTPKCRAVHSITPHFVLSASMHRIDSPKANVVV